MIAPGTYRAHAVDCALGLTGTGKEQVAVMFEIHDEGGSRLTWYGYFTDNTFDRTVQSLRHLGWKGNDLSVFGKGIPEDCHNEVEVVIEHEADQEDRLRAKIRWVNSGNGLAVKERMDENAARQFAARMKSRIAALGGATSVGTKLAPKPTTRGEKFDNRANSIAEDARPENFDDGQRQITDDDIPF